MATEIVKDTELHQFHRTLVLNNKPSWSNTNKNFFSKTRDQAQYVYTIQTYPTSQTNKSSGTPSSTKTKHYTMDSHNHRQWQIWLLILQTNHNTYATISNSFFSNIRDKRHTITNLPHQKGSNCFKKKTQEKERVRETGAPTWGPNPLGVNQESTTTEKKRGRKGRNPAIEDRGIKTSSVPSESSSG